MNDSLRKSLGIDSDVSLFVTATRVNASKKLEQVVDAISDLIDKGLKLKYIIIGFHNDEYGKQLKKYILDKKCIDHIEVFPFMSHNKLRQFYCAADIGIWTKAAISIQESMGTGLPILTKKRESLTHIINENLNGWFYNDDLLSSMNDAVKSIHNKSSKLSLERRKDLAKINKENLSYDIISKKIIEL